jgi:nickel-type superoxide dismutase maturation protease
MVELSEIPDLRLIDFFLLLTSRRSRFKIQGTSMLPSFHDGEEVIAKVKNYILEVNDVVVLYHPLRSNLIMLKRIKQITIEEGTKQKKYFVEGDNAEESTDSRHFDWVNEDLIIGKVVCRF